jgi:peptide deformylase
MIDPIVLKGAPVLGHKTKEVPKDMFGTKELDKLVKRMSASVRSTRYGVALSANQIGLSWRMFVVRGFVMAGMERKDSGADDIPDVAFVNPRITKTSRKKELLDEACLSVPGFHGNIKRSERVTVRAQSLDGKRFERGASGLLAQIFQHETDHLDGILYVDRAETVFEAEPEDQDESGQPE